MDEEDFDTNSIASSSGKAAILLCPTCNKAIPEIMLKSVDKGLSVVVSCYCNCKALEIPIEEFVETQRHTQSNKEIVICLEHQKETRKYCLECMQWFCVVCLENHQKKFEKHQCVFFELKVLCHLHKKIFLKHCKTCKQSICSECLGKHQKHEIVNINKVNDSNFQQDFKDINNWSSIFRDKKNFFMNKIIQQIEDLNKKLLYLQKLKKEVEEAFIINEQINRSLSDFSTILITTSLTIPEFPNYQLAKQFQTLRFTKPNIDLEGYSIEELFTKLKKFYNDNYILKQIEVDERTLQFQENFNLKKIECFATLTEYTNIVSSLIQLSNGHLASGYQKEIKLWSNETYTCYANLVEHTDTVECLLQVDDDLLSGSYDNTIKIWNLQTKKVKGTLNGHTNYVIQIMLMKDGQLASSSDDKSIKLWNLKAYVCTMTLTGHTGIIFSLILLHDGQIATGSGDKTIKLWGLNNIISKINHTITGHTSIVFCVIQLSNRFLASSSYDQTIKLWNIAKTPECKATLTGHTDYVRSLYQLNDGRIISGAADADIKFWDSNAPYNCLATISSHRDVITCLIQLQNGIIASGSWDMTIKLWTY